MRFLPAAILGVALLAATAHAGDKKKDDPSQIGNRDVAKGVNFYSLEREMALGKQLAEEVQRQAKMVDDPLISEYVNRLGQNLARNSDAKVPFTFRVIQGDALNAFALPGGYVFVYSGLIKVADEEDEFAGAVAHEIAHVAARHMTRQATKAQLADILTAPLGAVLGGWAGYGARQAAGLAIPMTFLSFSRHDETEADYLGVQYMYAAGYDPNGAVSIFEKMESLERKKPGAIAKVFSTHPMDADRISRTQQEIDRILPSKPEYVVTTSDYRNMRERLMDLENRRPGVGEDGRPRLRVNPGAGKAGDQTDTGDRPTIHRRDLVE
ncbi:MAG: M48 family metalloprotease [Acidobacteriia bacterium]|nr:M48 family metalloprotease [Terriglobia bacterium]